MPMKHLATVAVFRGVPIPYTYEIPENWVASVQVGHQVQIPFGKSHAEGLVLNIETAATVSEKTKSLLGYFEDRPKLEDDLVALLIWFSQHYATTPFKSFQTIAGNRKQRAIPDTPPFVPMPSPHTLTDEQSCVVDTISQSQGFDTHLIFGVTGSGKTEIYMNLAQKTLEKGQKVIILLPEIALTPQFTRVFEERFGTCISVIHSGLTPKKRDEAWSRIVEGKTDIVLGPRSAVFSPLSQLGLVIIDEEHENTYKQDSHPRYYTHRVAEFRCQYLNIPLVLGSATPSIESYFTANQHQHIHRLSARVLNRPMPAITVLPVQDMSSEDQQTALTKPLRDAVSATLAKGEKTLILVNRRGYAPYIACQKCGTVHACPHCGLSFTYHKDRQFRCHRCAISEPLHHTCSKCKKPALSFGGTGIQKVEAELHKFFPDKTIYRLDKDTAKHVKDVDRILTQFKTDGDILVGTQLIAKGHDIPEVTMVGIVGIDTTLNIPDFRSAERTFQLITQVAGRAGRGEKPGQVVLQTAQADHYAIRHAATHDFMGFYTEELAYREALWYPPFCELVHLIISSKSAEQAKTFALAVGTQVAEALAKTQLKHQCIGPVPSPIERVQNHFRWSILIKYERENEAILRSLLADLPMPKPSIRFFIDFEPKSLL
ncbi:MAG: primosomal protein N' [Candidatus Margulisiibacteriota bacterium]